MQNVTPSHVSEKSRVRGIIAGVVAMTVIVAVSNFLVQFPVHARVGPIDLANLLTWAAFTYPVAFLVTDLTNRQLGPEAARRVVYAGFILAVFLSIWLASERIAFASGSAFLIAQLLDVFVFNRLRKRAWWLPPLVSSFIGSFVDTFVFFSLAFSATIGSMLGQDSGFPTAAAPLFGIPGVMEAPRWISWALGDLVVKLLMALVLLAPYGALRKALDHWFAARTAETVAH